MTEQEIREAMNRPEGLNGSAFAILKEISCLINDPSRRVAGQDLLLRALDHRDQFERYSDVISGLVRKVGLFPYLEPDELGLADTIAYEAHRPAGMGEAFVFHREQATIYHRLLAGDSVILSAPTSFGKSRVIDALLASGNYANVALIVPTLALMDETRRRLSVFRDRFKVITHTSQAAGKRNIFVLTAERAVAYESMPQLDLLVVDEFYKLDDLEDEGTRAIVLNQCFQRLRKLSRQFYLLGPSVERIADNVEASMGCYFYDTRYATVATNQIHVSPEGDKVDRLVELVAQLQDPTLVYCSSPARSIMVARSILDSETMTPVEAMEDAAIWIEKHYHADWTLCRALRHGVGIHHGRLPRAIAQFIVRAFNAGDLRSLVCTSTLIEGVNTKAKNVIVFDNKIANRKLDFFTFNNIRGRSGRMFSHFVGNVYLFNAPPQEELPLVDFPLVTQGARVPEALLLQLEGDELSEDSRERIRKYANDPILPIGILRQNSGIEPDLQVRTARYIDDNALSLAPQLAWTGFPTYAQLVAVCDLIWNQLMGSPNRRHGVSSAKQLAFRTWQLYKTPDPKDRISQSLEPGPFMAKSPDEAVDGVLEFDRGWASFELPRQLTALERIQRHVLGRRGVPAGNYSGFAAAVESLFTNPVVSALDEFGVPLQLGSEVVRRLDNPETIDDALARLQGRLASDYSADPFERSILGDALGVLSGRPRELAG